MKKIQITIISTFVVFCFSSYAQTQNLLDSSEPVTLNGILVQLKGVIKPELLIGSAGTTHENLILYFGDNISKISWIGHLKVNGAEVRVVDEASPIISDKRFYDYVADIQDPGVSLNSLSYFLHSEYGDAIQMQYFHNEEIRYISRRYSSDLGTGNALTINVEEKRDELLEKLTNIGRLMDKIHKDGGSIEPSITELNKNTESIASIVRGMLLTIEELQKVPTDVDAVEWEKIKDFLKDAAIISHAGTYGDTEKTIFDFKSEPQLGFLKSTIKKLSTKVLPTVMTLVNVESSKNNLDIKLSDEYITNALLDLEQRTTEIKKSIEDGTLCEYDTYKYWESVKLELQNILNSDFIDQKKKESLNVKEWSKAKKYLEELLLLKASLSTIALDIQKTQLMLLHLLDLVRAQKDVLTFTLYTSAQNPFDRALKLINSDMSDKDILKYIFAYLEWMVDNKKEFQEQFAKILLFLDSRQSSFSVEQKELLDRLNIFKLRTPTKPKRYITLNKGWLLKSDDGKSIFVVSGMGVDKTYLLKNLGVDGDFIVVWDGMLEQNGKISKVYSNADINIFESFLLTSEGAAIKAKYFSKFFSVGTDIRPEEAGTGYQYVYKYEGSLKIRVLEQPLKEQVNETNVIIVPEGTEEVKIIISQGINSYDKQKNRKIKKVLNYLVKLSSEKEPNTKAIEFVTEFLNVMSNHNMLNETLKVRFNSLKSELAANKLLKDLDRILENKLNVEHEVKNNPALYNIPNLIALTEKAENTQAIFEAKGILTTVTNLKEFVPGSQVTLNKKIESASITIYARPRAKLYERMALMFGNGYNYYDLLERTLDILINRYNGNGNDVTIQELLVGTKVNNREDSIFFQVANADVKDLDLNKKLKLLRFLVLCNNSDNEVTSILLNETDFASFFIGMPKNGGNSTMSLMDEPEFSKIKMEFPNLKGNVSLQGLRNLEAVFSVTNRK